MPTPLPKKRSGSFEPNLNHPQIITITARSYRLKDRTARQADKSKEQTTNEPNEKHKSS